MTSLIRWFCIFLLGLSGLFFNLWGVGPAYGASPELVALGKKIQSIEVRGLKRIEKDAVLHKILTKPGQIVTQEQLSSDVQALFKMGYFDDIEVQGEITSSHDVQLIYVVKERPVISKIEFEGNEQLSSSDLKDVIKVKDWSILDVNKVKEDVALLQKHYEEKGYYLAKISFEIRPKGDEVELIYKINDYEKVQIKKITFLNNQKFSEEQLKSILVDTREGGFFSFMSGSGSFKESAFKQDLQRLVYWYLDHGYIKFRYENPVITVSDDKKWLYISIYVDEGETYQMGNIDFAGDLLFSKEELHSELSLISGDIFSYSKRSADILHLAEKYQDLGYAFANVIPKLNVHEDTRKIDIEYDFEKGNLVYFGEINVLGNSKTHDKVIRRELKIHEGELFSGSQLRKSRENVERLGYFAPGEVVFNTVTPKDKNDILNVEITVKERSTGTINLGAGFGSLQGFFLTAQISEINLFGRGQALSLTGQLSLGGQQSGMDQELQRSLNLGFTDNYAFDTLWSTGFDVYYVKTPIPNKYYTSRLGFDVKLGYPIAEYVLAYITYKLEHLDLLKKNPDVPDYILNADRGVLSSLIWSVVRDKRNNRFETTAGNYQSVSIETAGLGGDKSFIKWVMNSRFYTRVIGDLVFRNNVEIGQIYGIGDRPIPPSEKFYLGGPNNMRGFQMFLLGPLLNTASVPLPLGGTTEAYTMLELEYPLVREAGIKTVAFLDIGNTWQGGDPLTIRADAGIGIRWFSPMGPLRFEWGFPFSPSATEMSPQFYFMIGPPF